MSETGKKSPDIETINEWVGATVQHVRRIRGRNDMFSRATDQYLSVRMGWIRVRVRISNELSPEEQATFVADLAAARRWSKAASDVEIAGHLLGQSPEEAISTWVCILALSAVLIRLTELTIEALDLRRGPNGLGSDDVRQ